MPRDYDVLFAAESVEETLSNLNTLRNSFMEVGNSLVAELLREAIETLLRDTATIMDAVKGCPNPVGDIKNFCKALILLTPIEDFPEDCWYAHECFDVNMWLQDGKYTLTAYALNFDDESGFITVDSNTYLQVFSFTKEEYIAYHKRIRHYIHYDTRLPAKGKMSQVEKYSKAIKDAYLRKRPKKENCP